MHKYIIKRLLMMIPVLIGVTFLVFFILAISPGDPTRMILGQQASQESIEAMREELGLNDNLFVRYFDYIVGALHGDLGTSWKPSWRFCADTGIFSEYRYSVDFRHYRSDLHRRADRYSFCEKTVYLDRQCHSRAGSCRCGHAELLAGTSARYAVFSASGLVPAVRNGTGDRTAAEPGSAGADAGHQLCGQYHENDPLQHAGGDASGLHRYGQIQRSERKIHHTLSYV